MQRIIYIFFILLSFTSCEEVIDLDLETSKERLVIEAFINWEKGTSGNEQEIRLSKTSSYYNNQNIPATGATITITHQNGVSITFNEVTDGIYKTTSFQPEINATYILQILYGSEIYTATEKLVPVPEIDEITQSIENGFSNTDPEINVLFTDPSGTENYYRISYKKTRIENGNTQVTEEYSLYEDQFEDGNELSDFFENDDIVVNDEFQVSLIGISNRFYRYSELIQNQVNPDVGPFSTLPVNVKGNCINTTNKDNYPYGYFSLSEVDKETYTYQ